MSELYLVIAALVFGIVVGILFWVDYRRSTCAYGGDGFGENNWRFGGSDHDDD